MLKIESLKLQTYQEFVKFLSIKPNLVHVEQIKSKKKLN